MCGSEEVAEGIVEQVDEGSCVEICIAHHLGGEQSLSGAAAEKATHHAVAHVHVMCDFLKTRRIIKKIKKRWSCYFCFIFKFGEDKDRSQR